MHVCTSCRFGTMHCCTSFVCTFVNEQTIGWFEDFADEYLAANKGSSNSVGDVLCMRDDVAVLESRVKVRMCVFFVVSLLFKPCCYMSSHTPHTPPTHTNTHTHTHIYTRAHTHIHTVSTRALRSSNKISSRISKHGKLQNVLDTSKGYAV